MYYSAQICDWSIEPSNSIVELCLNISIVPGEIKFIIDFEILKYVQTI